MERYTRLYTLPENLYTQGSPVTIAAGALLLDNQTGSVMAQLKFRNVSQHDIKAVFVSVEAFDVAHTQLSGVESYQYLDLQEKRDAEFGQKQAIRLPDATARSFAPRCTRVVLDDDTLWEAPENAAWESLPKPTPISEKVSGELLEQHKRDTAEYAVYAPESFSGLWLCTCGELNEETEETCHICRLSRQTQTDALNEEALQEHLTAYEAAEAEKAEKLRAEQEAIEAEKAAERAVRKKKARKIFAIIGAAALLCVAVALLITKVIIPNNKYNAAAALMNDGQYEEAISAFRAMDGYKDSTEQITECRYLHAIALIDEGKIVEAYESLLAMNGYKDSAEKAADIYEAYKQARLSMAEAGDYVLFGNYEQDNNTTNGKEHIEWLVLAKKNNKILVISKYVLDCQQFNTKLKDVTWETCTLRKWLNSDFISAAFSEDEQALIQITNVSADKNPSYDTDPGKTTKDKIFLLSLKEENQYFASDKERMCHATAYAKAQGAFTSDDWMVDGEATTGMWWLRTPGSAQRYFGFVDTDGRIFGFIEASGVIAPGRNVDSDVICVRHAVWIDLDS